MKNLEFLAENGQKTMGRQLIELLTFGYIRELEKSLDVNLIIPDEICKVILLFYPALAKFDWYNEACFDVSDDGTIIKGKKGCAGFFVYAEHFGTNGYKKGVHCWSLKCIAASNCYRYFGIYSKRKRKYLDLSKSGKGGGYKHKDQELETYLNGGYNNWLVGEIWTVVLDCESWNVYWFRNNALHEKGKDQGRYWILFCGTALCIGKISLSNCRNSTTDTQTPKKQHQMSV